VRCGDRQERKWRTAGEDMDCGDGQERSGGGQGRSVGGQRCGHEQERK
jgi:hypothetical protein